jgi:hypothetical protein
MMNDLKDNDSVGHKPKMVSKGTQQGYDKYAGKI